MSSQSINLNWYKMFFPFNFNYDKRLCFDATINNLGLPFVRDWIYKIHSKNNTLNKVKFIILVREPISRFKSNLKSSCSLTALFEQFGMKRNVHVLRQLPQILDKDNKDHKDNKDKNRTCAHNMYKQSKDKDKIIQDVIDFNLSDNYKSLVNKFQNGNEPKSIADWQAVSVMDRCSFVTRGFYDENIERYFEKFDKTQFLVIDIEQLNPDQIKDTLITVCKFLLSDNDEFNGASYESIICNGDFCGVKYKHCNQGGSDSIKLNKKTVEYLKSIYKPHNQRLFHLIGKTFDW